MSIRQLVGLGLIVLLMALTVAGCSLLEEPEEASEPISAVPLDSAESETEGDTSDSGAVVFTIVSDESEARFSINEILRGSPTTAVGITDQVGAEISVDYADPKVTEVGTVTINARTIATDAGNRNQAIRQFILNTDEFEFITFTPTTITGLPDSVSFGESYSFQITGDLTIRDITQETTFEATVTPVSETRVEGSASATVSRGDFGLTIPSVPFVAEVDDEVLLEIDFVAVPK